MIAILLSSRCLRIAACVALVVAAPVFFEGCSRNTAQESLVEDIAVVLGPPISRGVENYPAYPVFVKGARVHTWLDARGLDKWLKPGEEVGVNYNKGDIPTRTLNPLYISPLTQGEAK